MRIATALALVAALLAGCGADGPPQAMKNAAVAGQSLGGLSDLRAIGGL